MSEVLSSWIERPVLPQRPETKKLLDYSGIAFSKWSSIIPDGPEKDAFRNLIGKVGKTALRCFADKLTNDERKILFNEMEDGKSPSEWLKNPKSLEEYIKTKFLEQFTAAEKDEKESEATAEASKATAEASKATAEASKATAEASKATAESEMWKKLFWAGSSNSEATRKIKEKYSTAIEKWEKNNELPRKTDDEKKIAEKDMPFSEKQELARNMLRDLAEESRKLQEIASSPTATSEQKQAAQEAKTTLASFASEFHSAGLISTAELEQYKNAFSKVEELRTEKKIDEKISSVLPKDSVKLSTEAGGKEQYASFDKRETGKTSFDSILTIDAEKNQVSEKIASSKSGYSVSIDYPLEAGKDSAKLQEKLQRTERSKKNLEGIVEEYKELDTLSQDPEVLDSIPKEASAKQEDIRTLQSKKDRTPLEEKRLRKYILEEKKSRLVESGAPKNTEDLQGYVQSIEKQIADIHNQLKTAPNTPNTSKESLKNNAREIVEFMDTIGLSYLGEKNADTVLLEMYKKSDGGEGKLPIKLTDGNPPKIDASNKMEADAKTRIQKMFAEYLGKAAAFDQNTNPPTIKELDESGKTIDFRAKFISAGILDVDGNLKKHVGSEEK